MKEDWRTKPKNGFREKNVGTLMNLGKQISTKSNNNKGSGESGSVPIKKQKSSATELSVT